MFLNFLVSSTIYKSFCRRIVRLRGVSSFLWSNVINYGHMMIAVFLLFKVPDVSALAAEDTTLRIFLHSVCMGPFLSGLGFIGLGEGQFIR